MEYHGGIYA